VHVAIAIEKFDPHVGGAERYCWDLAQFLAGRGHKITIICMRASGQPHPDVELIRVPALRFPQFLRHLSFAILHFFRARKMRGVVHFCVGNTFYMDLYQPHGGVHRAWFLGETSRYGQPARGLVRLLMRLSLKDMVQRAFEWWTFRVSRPRVIAISDMVAQDMRRFFHYPGDMIRLIPNGIDLDRYHPGNRVHRDEVRKAYGIGPDEFVFLFVAQNPRLKGYDVLLDACRELGHMQFKVLSVGGTDAHMRKDAGPLGGRVIFAGRSTELDRIYAACDCLVHPTYYDACSLVVLESLASGIPVITTSANGAGMFLDGSNGCVINPGDPSALARAMEDMMIKPRGEVNIGMKLKNQAMVFSQVEEAMNGWAP
jgi:UDP-glucose:(heptosyl)LPS alpha-1,3-glucosyltransferase